MWRPTLVAIGLAGCAGSSAPDIEAQEITPQPLAHWTQTHGTAQHTGLACKPLRGMHVTQVIAQDVDADEENAQGGFLSKHEGPLLEGPGGYVYIPTSSGFTGTDVRTEQYALQIWRWPNGLPTPGAKLQLVTSVPTDWIPVDAAVRSFGFVTNGYVQQLGAVAANGSVYVPAFAGRMMRLSAATGAVQAVIDPFAGTTFSGDKFVVVNNVPSSNPVTGDVLYSVVAYPTFANPVLGDLPRAAWGVIVHPDNTTLVVSWDQIASPAVGIPAIHDLCEYPFGTGGTAPATGPDSKAPLFGCGPQLPAINAPIAVTADGAHLKAFSYANNAQGAAFIVTLNATTLQPEFASDTRGHALHGCGVRLDLSGTCNTITANGTTHLGFDPNFNGPVRFRGEGLMDSAPAIGPDGTTCIGNYDGGFSFGGDGTYDARGFGVCFDRYGNFVSKNETFYWEVTGAALGSASNYRWYTDRNLYSKLELGAASYTSTWGSAVIGSPPLNLDAVAVDTLDAATLVDSDGRFYAVDGDGHIDQFAADGTLTDSVDTTDETGAPLSMETLSGYHACAPDGTHYFGFAGRYYVVQGNGGPGHIPPARAPRTAAHAAAMAAKARRAAETPMPIIPVSDQSRAAFGGGVTREPSTTIDLCQLDPSTGRCKTFVDPRLAKARDATASYLTVPKEEIVCGNPGGDDGVYQCDRYVPGGVVDCVVVFTEGGLIEELHCSYLPLS